MGFKEIILASIVFVILSEVVNTAVASLTMGYYTDPNYFGLWSKLMMSTNGPPSATFFMASIIFSFITGVVFAWAYHFLIKVIPSKSLKKGFNFGIFLFLVVGVPFSLTTYLILAVPAALLLYWALSSLIVYTLSGMAFAKLIKK